MTLGFSASGLALAQLHTLGQVKLLLLPAGVRGRLAAIRRTIIIVGGRPGAQTLTGSDATSILPGGAPKRWRSVAAAWLFVASVTLVAFPGVASADLTAVEGQSFSGHVANTCSFMGGQIDWGDGTPTSAGSDDGTGVTGTHTYAEEGTFNGSVSYVCPAISGVQHQPFQATVQDAPLSAAGQNISGTAGQALTAVTAHVTDANPFATASDFSAQIAWGDGTTTAGSVSAAAGGGFDVTGTHTYNSAGTYPVNSSITDIGGSSATASSTAQIGAAAAPPPRVVEAPVVSGVAHETDKLTTTTGFWSGSPSAYQFQWLRCATPTGGSCVVVPDATSASYTLVHADVGSTMRSRVRAANAVGTSLPADSAPTAVVKPLVLTAGLTISPNPTCTGITVTFDASTSTTPNPPIERYQFTERVDRGAADFFGFPVSTLQSAWLVSDGTASRVSEVPTYDSVFTEPYVLNSRPPAQVIARGTYLANQRDVTLTVRDRAGDTATVTHTLNFDPFLSALGSLDPHYFKSRASCPPSFTRAKARVTVHGVKFKATKKTVSAKIPCATIVDCAGSLQLYRAFSRVRRHAKPLLLASSSYYVTGHHTASIIANLTAAGRSLLSHGKPLATIARFTTVNPIGKTTTQSLTVTLVGSK